MREIVCVTPPSASGSGTSSVKLFIDKAEVTSLTHYIYTEDPTISSVEPNWSIIKYVNTISHTLNNSVPNPREIPHCLPSTQADMSR